jgi:hypothetical protein
MHQDGAYREMDEYIERENKAGSGAFLWIGLAFLLAGSAAIGYLASYLF